MGSNSKIETWEIEKESLHAGIVFVVTNHKPLGLACKGGKYDILSVMKHRKLNQGNATKAFMGIHKPTDTQDY